MKKAAAGERDDDPSAVVFDQWKQHEKDSEKQALVAQLREESNPTRKPLHQLFKSFNLITILAAILMALGQCVGVFFSPLGIIDYVLRIYVVLFCLLVVLNESEFYALTRDSRLLRIWIFRGMFYAFIGILGLNEHAAAAGSNNLDDEGYKHRDVAVNFTVIVAWIMVLIGMLYVLMGVLCLQLVYNRLEEAYRERLVRSREVRRSTKRYGGIGDDVV